MIPESEYIRIAKITGSHGLNGGVKIFITSAIIDRFKAGNIVYLKIGEIYKKYTISDFRQRPDRISLLWLSEVTNRTDADSLKGTEIFIDGSCAESFRENLEEDAFFYYDIIGSSVFYRNEFFGKVVDVFDAGAGDILVIEDSKGKRYMVPFVESMVDTAKISERVIIVNPVEGLLDI